MFDSDDIKAVYWEPKIEQVYPYAPAIKSILDYEGKGLSSHTFEAIGKSVLFPLAHWKWMFPSGAANGFQLMIERGGIPGVMCKEEALTLTYELSWMRLPTERKIDYEQMLKDSINTKELIKDDN